MPHDSDPKTIPDLLPIYGPELQIVPQEEKGGDTGAIKKERQIIDDLFKNDVELPWIKPSKRKKGQA